MQKLKKPIMVLSIILLFCASGLSNTYGVQAEAVTDNRYEVFMLTPSLPGCNPTTMTFRSDGILNIQCMDGFGMYLAFGNFFVAFYRAPDFDMGRDVTLVLGGFALDPFIVASGMSYIGNNSDTFMLTGYSLTPSQ